MSSPANPDESTNEEKDEVIAKASAECLENLLKMVEAQEVLNNHAANESPGSSKPFKCDICGRAYAVQQTLKWHYAKYHKMVYRTRIQVKIEEPGRSLYKCKFCPKQYDKLNSLRKHCSAIHKRTASGFDLTKRGYNYSQAAIVTVDDIKPVLAQAGGKIGSLRSHHVTQKKLEKDNSDYHFHCQYCPMKFPLHQGLSGHMRSEHNAVAIVQPESGSLYKCKFCPKQYDKLNSLQKHCSAIHKRTASGFALRKSEVSNLRSSLITSTPSRAHVSFEKTESSGKQVTPGSSNQVRCKHCSMTFKNNAGMKNHTWRAHPEQSARRIESEAEVFACKFCPKKYDRQTSWLRHCQTAHNCTPKYTPVNQKKSQLTNETPQSVRITTASHSKQESSNNSDPLQCDKCDRVFSTVDFLTKHKLTHSIVRPSLTCNHCGELFKEMALLKKHKDQECGKKSNVDVSMKESPEEASRKRVRKESQLSNDDEVFPVEPLAKRFNVKQEPQSFDNHSEESINEILAASLIIKTEPVDSYQREQPYIPNMVVAKTYEPDVDQTQVETVGEASDSLMIANQMIDNTAVFNRDSPLPRIPVSPSVVSDFSSVSQRQQSIHNIPALISPLPVPTIEKSPLPLSAGIFTRTVQFPKELMILWSYSMEEDLLSAVSLNMNIMNDLYSIKKEPCYSRGIMVKRNVTFNMLDSSDTFTPWTAIYFGEENCPNGLKKKLFRSFSDVEKTLSEHARTRGMTMNSVMRYTEDGLFPLLSKNLNEKLVVFNFVA